MKPFSWLPDIETPDHVKHQRTRAAIAVRRAKAVEARTFWTLNESNPLTPLLRARLATAGYTPSKEN